MMYQIEIRSENKKWRLQYSLRQIRIFRDRILAILQETPCESRFELQTLHFIKEESISRFFYLLSHTVIPAMIVTDPSSEQYLVQSEIYRFSNFEKNKTKNTSVFQLNKVPKMNVVRPRSMSRPSRTPPSLSSISELN